VLAVAGAAAPTDRAATMRRAIARTMSRSNREIPHYHLASTVDLDAAVAWLREHNEGRPPAQRLLPAALVLRAVALAAVRTPQLNGAWVDDAFVPGVGVHLGIAVSLRGGGLIAPVLHDADRLGPDEIMAVLTDLVARSRRGALRASEVDGAGLTVTNLGDRGVEVVHGVIHPPQVALVGVGRIQQRALVVDGAVVARPSTVVSLAADHRATDGQVGSRLLNDIDALLQRPDEL
jgi:pyruvate dehydrogenase E2 component (dihydrolipoamide acetyltransferase)